jgi:hypothetical protein
MHKQVAAMPLFIMGGSCIELQTGRGYAATIRQHVNCIATNRLRLRRYNSLTCELHCYKQVAATPLK